MAPRVRYVDSGGASIAWSAVGEGPRELAFVPGFVSHQEILWEEPLVARFFERLSSFARLILWDKREQGLSDRTGRPPTLEQSMDDLRAVLEAAGSERPALVGVSEGGPMTMLFAATYPERVDRLAVIGSYARILAAPGYDAGADPEQLERFCAGMLSHWGEAVGLRAFAPSLADDPRVRAWWARLLRSGASPRTAADLLLLYRQLDVRHVLPAVRVPTLVLHRAGDRLTPVEQGRYVAAHIPAARYVELAGDDHLPFAGDADALLDELQDFLTGTRPPRQADRVLATVLFEDIVGSTRLAAELGDGRWRGLLAEHDRLAADAVQRFGGRVVKTLGDGVLATFDGPARAIRGALAIRDGAGALGLDVRAGLHTGELEQLDGDVGGIAVHIGARVAAAAGPGEVLVSRTVADLVAGSGLAFADRGEHELKGVPDTWRLFAAAT